MTIGILIGVAVAIGFFMAARMQQSRAKFEALVTQSTGQSERVTLFDERASWDAGYYVMAFFICAPSVICSFLHADVVGALILSIDVIGLTVIGFSRQAQTSALRVQYDVSEKPREMAKGSLA